MTELQSTHSFLFFFPTIHQLSICTVFYIANNIKQKKTLLVSSKIEIRIMTSYTHPQELIVHSIEYLSTLPPLEIIDKRLKEFVRLHHMDRLRACSYHKCKLNIQILIKQFSKQLEKFHLTTKQV